MSSQQTSSYRAAAAAAAAIAASLAFATPALAQEGTYLGVHAGGHNVNNWSHRVDFGAGAGAEGSLTLDSKEHWGVMAGRQMGEGRLELEYEQGRFEVTGLSLGAVSASRSGSGDYEVLMFNVYRSFELADPVNAYVAAGAGFGRVKLPALAALGNCNCYGSASHTGFSAQLRAGAEYMFQGGYRVFLQYTVLRLPGADSGAPPSVAYSHKNVNAFTAGLRKAF